MDFQQPRRLSGTPGPHLPGSLTQLAWGEEPGSPKIPLGTAALPGLGMVFWVTSSRGLNKSQQAGGSSAPTRGAAEGLLSFPGDPDGVCELGPG